MRKHFLLLLLMTLLPLAGWAADLTVGLTTLSKTWGDADPVHPTTAQFTFNGTSDQKAALVNYLTFTRVDAGTDVGSYAYTWTLDPAYKDNTLFAGDDVFIGTPNGVLNITAKNITTATFTVTLDAESYTYTGTAVEPTITSLKIGELDIASADYDVTFTNNAGAGTGNMTITGKNNLTGSQADVQAFTIVGGMSLEGKTATYAGDALTYTGLAQTPTNFTIEGLTYGTDFEVKAGSYANNTNAGTAASVTLKGIGNYAATSEITANFEIAKATATITPAAKEKNFGAKEPTFTATVAGAVNSEELVYTIKRKNFGDVAHEQPGTYSKALYVDFDPENAVNKNYNITAGEAKFTINKKAMNASGMSYSNIADQVYDATKAASDKGITTTYTLKNKYAALEGNQYYTLVEGEDFTVTYSNNTTVGEATVSFKGAGTKFNPGTTKDQTFNITAKPVALTAKVEPTPVGYGSEYNPGVTWGDGVTDADKTALGDITYSYKKNNDGAEGADVANPSEVGKYFVYANFVTPNTNYSVTATKGEFEITAGQVIASISATATYGSLPTFTLTHVSGLSTTEAASFNATNNLTTVTVKQGTTTVLDGVAKNADGLKALAAGEYDLEATASCGDSYTVIVSAGKLTVNPNAAYVFTIEDIAAVKYKAAKWEPEVTVSGLTAGTDYTVSYGDDTHDNINAGTGIVKIAGAGNYAGATGSKTFTINKADLTITADNFTGEKAWTYGTDEPTYTATVDGLKGNDALTIGGTLDGIEGTLKVKRTSNETVGMHTGALVAGFYDADDNKIAAPVATNYNLAFNPGDLQVAKGAVVIQLKKAVTATYGDDPATSINAAIKDITNYEYVSGLSELEAANFASIINVGAATHELVAATKYEVGTDYTFTIDGATSTNYGVTINPGTYNVNPADITLYANDQAIDWSDNDPDNDAADTDVKPATVTIAAGELKYTDALIDVVAEIVIASQNVGTNNISLTAAQNANYNIVVNSDGTNAKYGVLTVKGAPALALSTADADLADKLASYNGKAMPVTINFAARNARELPAGTARTWTADTWVTLTLPFDISVADLSKALGYAIVNVIDPSRTEVSGTSSKFYGKLTMKGGNGDGTEDYLVANKPFMVKTADAITGIIDFGTRTIVAPTDLSVDAGGGAKLTGTYATKNVTSADNAAIWFMIGGGNASWAYINTTSSATWDILPFEGFIDMSGSSARNMTFYFEELDGSTTAIKSINADDLNSKIAAEGMYNMNGMKLNTVPTQKGVYILNGKKVVIK